MRLNEFIEKGGQKLRLGYTTGSCAAGAAKAAAVMLLTGERILQVKLRTPRGIGLILDIEDICFWNEENEVISEAEAAGFVSDDKNEYLSDVFAADCVPAGKKEPLSGAGCGAAANRRSAAGRRLPSPAPCARTAGTTRTSPTMP